jgi:selenide,water dikinase
VTKAEKRKRVMGRSMRLGHCICDPKLSCPCELLRERDVCPCAGERLEPSAGPVRLTQLVEKPGCASKIDQAALKRILADLPAFSDPRVLVGVAAGDDAGVYRIGDDTALVQTVDVFTPCVDDPYTFGQIAAANSVSDVYAMGGAPLTALSIIGFPIRELPDRIMHDILRGGIDKMAEARVAIIGGHSINDGQVKAGFAITGLIDPRSILTNAGVRPGDCLLLTKALGTGILAFASQIGRAPAGALEAAARSMAALNRVAAERMREFNAHACTDITGFGLMGHLAEMAAASRVDVEITWDDVPLLPGVLECLTDGIIPGSVERNMESSGDRVTAGPDVESAMLDVCFDAQTSGGLLIAVAEPDAAPLLARLRADGIETAAIIGRALGAGAGHVAIRTNGSRPVRSGRSSKSTEVRTMEPTTNETGCCGGGHGTGEAVAGSAVGVTQIVHTFQDFLKASSAPNALDAHTKQAMAIALSVLSKCEPCVKIHTRKAREMGFSQDEIDEAAWMAVAFGGSPVMMFYNGVRDA